MKSKYGLLLLLLAIALPLRAAEYTDGDLRLVINESKGRFSLYSIASGTPIPLFADTDPRTSFLSVIIDDRSYKMGDAFAFKTRFYAFGQSLIYESSFMLVTQKFSFIRYPSGSSGLKIDITLENRGNRSVSAGARYLLDTSLGERLPGNNLSTSRKTISSETLINRYDGESYWKDSDGDLSLSGSIFTGAPADPDSVHIANWKKLADVTWKAPYQYGRNFNAPPYSTKDNAVCYYFEPRNLGVGEERTLSFILALNHEGEFTIPQTIAAFPATPAEQVFPIVPEEFDTETAGINDQPALESPIQQTAETEEKQPIIVPPVIAAAPKENTASRTSAEPVRDGSQDQDLAMLRILQDRINTHISAGTGTDGELRELETAINMLRAKYGLGNR